MSLEASLVGSVVYAQTTPASSSSTQTSSTSVPKGTVVTDDNELNEIVVSGFRQSLQTAIDVKRNSILPIESVAPEDIGLYPDQNVAESLQRLPGVQINRSQGQGTSVLIDGLRQNLTTLNGDVFLTGREFYVSGEGSGGGAGANSQYSSLQGIPSELVSGIDVIKNPQATMLEGGLGGIIDLKTADPLAQPQGLSLGGNMSWTSQQGNGAWTPDGALVGSYKVNDRLAFTASVSIDNEYTLTKEFQDQNRNQWVITNSATPPYAGVLTPQDITKMPNNQYYIDPQLAYFSNIYDSTSQKGAAVGVKFKVTDQIESGLQWFYSHYEDTSYTYSDKAWFNGQGQAPGGPLPGIDPTAPYSIDGNGVVQSATFNALGAETATLYQQAEDTANNFQWHTKYDGGPLRGLLDVSFSKATSDLQAAQADVEHGMYTTSSGVATSPLAPGCNNGSYKNCQSAPANPGYLFQWNNGGTSGLPSIHYVPNAAGDYADVLSNPYYTTFKSNWAWANNTENEVWAVRLDGAYDITSSKDLNQTLTGGIRYESQFIDQDFGRYLINGTLANGQVAGGNTGCNTPPGGAPGTCGPYVYYQDPGYGNPNIPYSTALSNPNLAMTVNNFAAGNIIVKNPTTGGMSNPGTYLNQVWAGAGVPNTTEALFKDNLSSFHVSDHTTAFYLMDDLDAPDKWHVNFGLRALETKLTINNGQQAYVPTYYGTASWNGVESNVVPVTTDRNYWDILPSVNFVYDLTDQQKVRLGLSKVVAPQDLFSLGVGNTYGFTRGNNNEFHFDGGSSGNTNLDPYRASQAIVTWEDYFAPSGLLSVGGFYKKVQSFVETQNIPTTIGGVTADVTQPVNAGGGKIYGLEFNAQWAFGEAISPWLRGLGAAANYTYSDSTSQQSTSFATNTPIPGVSKNSYTAQLYFERPSFSIRGSYTWRSSAVNDSLVGATFAFADQNGNQKVYQIYSAAYGQLDAQFVYNFNAHIGLIASVQNWTNQAQHTYLQWSNLPFTYDDSGTRYFLGIKGKY